jgi:hypothetical protein
MHARLPLALAFALAGAAPAAALDLPARKVGLWQLTMTFEGRSTPPHVTQQCVDAETDKLMNSIGGGIRQGTCSKQDLSRVGSTIVVDSVCQVGPATTTSRGVITGDFNSAYTIKSTSKREGGPAIPGAPAGDTTTMTIDAKWLGACKADQKPGDMIMANGMKMNIRDLQNLPGMTGGVRPPEAPIRPAIPQKK